MNKENNKLCPFTGLKEYCGKDCALYSEEYNGCCITNFGEEMTKNTPQSSNNIQVNKTELN